MFFISDALAQTAAPTSAPSLPLNDFIQQLGLPLVFMVAIFYFLLFRPQQRRAKQHQELIKNVRRGDTVITSGGLIGKVSKVVDDNELQIEIAEGVRVRVLRQMVSEVRTKGEPVKETPA